MAIFASYPILVERLIILFPNQVVDIHDLPVRYRAGLKVEELDEREALTQMFADVAQENPMHLDMSEPLLALARDRYRFKTTYDRC